jgi:hypothetical protein
MIKDNYKDFYEVLKETWVFCKTVDFENDVILKETITNDTHYLSYILEFYSDVRKERKLREVKEYLNAKANEGEKKLTEKAIEMIVKDKLSDLLSIEYEIEGLLDLLQQIIITARKMVELAIVEKRALIDTIDSSNGNNGQSEDDFFL